MDIRELEIQSLEISLTELLNREIDFKSENIKGILKIAIYEKFLTTEKLQNAMDDIINLQNLCVKELLTTDNNSSIICNLCNAQKTIINAEIEKSVAKDLSVLLNIISSDVMLEYFKDELPNLEKIIMIYEMMKDDNKDVTYFEVLGCMKEALDMTFIESITPDELFEVFNSELEKFLIENETIKEYRDKI